MDTKKNWKVAILFICVFATKISAQTPFTKRQVYDFNPGDVMQTTNKYTQTPGPPIYETDSIAERYVRVVCHIFKFKSQNNVFCE